MTAKKPTQIFSRTSRPMSRSEFERLLEKVADAADRNAEFLALARKRLARRGGGRPRNWVRDMALVVVACTMPRHRKNQKLAAAFRIQDPRRVANIIAAAEKRSRESGVKFGARFTDYPPAIVEQVMRLVVEAQGKIFARSSHVIK